MLKLSPKTFQVVCGVAFASLCVIVFTGALVRLTGSGLGCADWPRCSESKFIDVQAGHTLIEQANRLFTGVVSFSVIAAVLCAHRIRPKRKQLIPLAWSLVIGVLIQIGIGAVVVLTGLNPFANMAHFLVSMLLVTSGFILLRRSGDETFSSHFRALPNGLSRLTKSLTLLAVVVIVTGTVVTASGPHAGDENAVRLGFSLVSVARIHSISVISTLAVTIAILLRSTRLIIDESLKNALQALLFVMVLQGAIGYLQFFTGVPASLVAAHIIGALSFFIAVLNVVVQPST